MSTPVRRSTQGRALQRQVQKRSSWTRTTGDLLVDWVEPQGLWWDGSDGGGGLAPIGPHGPWINSFGPPKPIVTRATSLITGPLTAAPFKVQELGFGGQPLGRPRWLVDPMLVRPDDRFPTSDIYPQVLRLTRAAFWAEWVRASIWWGQSAFVYIESPVDGSPMAGSLRNIAPYCLFTQRDEGGALCWVIGDTLDAASNVVADRDGRFTLGPVTYRLCVLRNPHSPIDVEGLSQGVFAMNPSTFMLAGQIEAYTSGTFRSGVPSGYLKVLTPGLQQDDADKLKADWMEAHGNDRRSIAVLNAMVDFQALSFSPVDAALGEVKRLNIADTAFAFGLDPMTLGVSFTSSATYTNIRDAWDNHRDFGLAPYMAAVEDCLTALLPGTQGVKVNLDGFANPDLKTRMDGYSVGITAGVLTKDECRALEGLPPLEEPPAPPAPPVVEPTPPPVLEPAPVPIRELARPQALRR